MIIKKGPFYICFTPKFEVSSFSPLLTDYECIFGDALRSSETLQNGLRKEELTKSGLIYRRPEQKTSNGFEGYQNYTLITPMHIASITHTVILHYWVMPAAEGNFDGMECGWELTWSNVILCVDILERQELWGQVTEVGGECSKVCVWIKAVTASVITVWRCYPPPVLEPWSATFRRTWLMPAAACVVMVSGRYMVHPCDGKDSL